MIIEKQYLNDFKQKFYTSIDSNNKEVKEIYKVKYDNLPLTITNTFSELVNGVNLNDQRYGYKNIFNESNINQNYFDSKAESKFVELIRDYVLLDQGVQKNYALEMFCKNPTFKGVYIEYFDDNNNILKSYPDFIFRIKNNSTNEIIHDFYIEIKDNEDIDQNKTRLLRKAYKNYINSISSGVTENKRNMTLLILNIKILSLKMDKLPNVTCSGLSTINEINNIISEGKIYKGVEFLKDFFNISIERIIKIK